MPRAVHQGEGRMNRAMLIRVGECLYGPSPGWHEPLASDLAVSLRVMQRWAAGTRPIPNLEPELAALCHEVSRDLANLADELSAQQDA